MNRLINFSVKLTQRYLPDAYVLAIILTAIVFISGMLFADQSAVEMSHHWSKGFSSLFGFGMQMTLVLVTGFTLAQTPIVKGFLERLVKIPQTPRQAVILVTLVSFVTYFLNWGFGMVAGALVAREMGKQMKGLHFPMVVAAAYGAEIIRGPSSSIPVLSATPGHFLEEQMGVVSTSLTLFSGWNIAISLILLAAVMLLYINIKVPEDEIKPFIDTTGGDKKEEPKPIAKVSNMSPSDWLDNSRWVNWALAVVPIIYISDLLISGKFSLNLNIVIIIFLTLALIFHSSPAGFLDTVKEAVVVARGIIIQFPLYAGVAGMMGSSGLVDEVAQIFINISSAESFPILTFFSAGLVNVLIPSGGGQWVIQGPIMIQAALELGADIPQTIMAFAWGDAWTNQIQPFWALPLLGVAGLSARDIMGYCFVWLLLSGFVIATAFFILGFVL